MTAAKEEGHTTTAGRSDTTGTTLATMVAEDMTTERVKCMCITEIEVEDMKIETEDTSQDTAEVEVAVRL
jgi:hypothetical protein